MVDLAVKMAGVSFKNPILPAASELVFDGPSAKSIVEQGVGGIVTKTFITSPDFRIRRHPYPFPLIDPSLKKREGSSGGGKGWSPFFLKEKRIQ